MRWWQKGMALAVLAMAACQDDPSAIGAAPPSTPDAGAAPLPLAQDAGPSPSVEPPEVTSPSDRKAILALVEAAAEAQLSMDVALDVRILRVMKGWAFVKAVPTLPNGKPIASKVPLEAVALLHRVDGRWTLVTFTLGADGHPEQEWSSKYGSPPELIVIAELDLGLTSPARKAMLDALRIPLEKDLAQRVIFRIHDLRTRAGWVFVSAQPLQPDGTPIDYLKTHYKAMIDEYAFDDHVDALLYFDQTDWFVKIWELGSTDVPWEPWGARFGTPPGLFPGPAAE
jgi:hypothetical protein